MFQPFIPNNPYLPKVNLTKRQEVIDGQVFDIVEQPTGYENIEQSTMNSGTLGEGRITGTGRVSAPGAQVQKVGVTYNPLATVPVERGLQEPPTPAVNILPPPTPEPYNEGVMMAKLYDKQNPFAKFQLPVLPEPIGIPGVDFKDSRTDMRLGAAPSFNDYKTPPVVNPENIGDNSMVPQGQELALGTAVPGATTTTEPGIPGIKFNAGRTDIVFGNKPTTQAAVTDDENMMYSGLEQQQGSELLTTQQWPTDATYKPLGESPVKSEGPIDMKEISLFNQQPTMPKTGPVPQMNVTPYDSTMIGQDGKPAATPVTEQPGAKDNTTGMPEKYYAGKAILDAGALFNNMIQQPPPNMQMIMPQFERMRLDRTPYEQARTDIGEAQTGAYRQMREGISQASDLMKGVSAVTSGTQEQLAQIGVSEAGAQLGVEQQNQNIAMQEAQMQAQTINNEQQMNYQIQQQAQARKDELISAQLGRIGDTAGAYANFSYMKEQADKMTQLSKEQANMTNELQAAMLQYEIANKELSSESFQEAQNTAVTKYMMDTKDKLYNDPKYAKLKETYGDNYSPLEYQGRAQSVKLREQQLDAYSRQFNGFKDAPVRKDGEEEVAWQKRLGDYNTAKAYYDKAKEDYDNTRKTVELEGQFYNELKTSFDVSGEKEAFKSRYLTERGLPSNSDIVGTVKSLIERSRQM